MQQVGRSPAAYPGHSITATRCAFLDRTLNCFALTYILELRKQLLGICVDASRYELGHPSLSRTIVYDASQHMLDLDLQVRCRDQNAVHMSTADLLSKPATIPSSATRNLVSFLLARMAFAAAALVKMIWEETVL